MGRSFLTDHPPIIDDERNPHPSADVCQQDDPPRTSPRVGIHAVQGTWGAISSALTTETFMRRHLILVGVLGVVLTACASIVPAERLPAAALAQIALEGRYHRGWEVSSFVPCTTGLPDASHPRF